jgi:hypothetical protein
VQIIGTGPTVYNGTLYQFTTKEPMQTVERDSLKFAKQISIPRMKKYRCGNVKECSKLLNKELVYAVKCRCGNVNDSK